ncbi:Hypothetical protein, putative [Bodo saltans]|uniref:TBC1 domain family member 23 n=1 Tax=Bodo saltans TaxID=75058 RepID=A0A0S4IJZ6_BODSA|nr:Hypothetical protein, putative [Bodo saltans]|eukprot:CUE61656.1 Hypothetical protein, putative [Bodo saltans]
MVSSSGAAESTVSSSPPSSIVATYVNTATASHGGGYASFHATAPFASAALTRVRSVVVGLRTAFLLAEMHQHQRQTFGVDSLTQLTTSSATIHNLSSTSSSPSSTINDSDAEHQCEVDDDAVLLDHFSPPIDVLSHSGTADWCFLHVDPPSTLREWLQQRRENLSIGIKTVGATTTTTATDIESLHRQLCGVLVAWLRSCQRWCVGCDDDVTATCGSSKAAAHVRRSSRRYIPLMFTSLDDFGVTFESPMHAQQKQWLQHQEQRRHGRFGGGAAQQQQQQGHRNDQPQQQQRQLRTYHMLRPRGGPCVVVRRTALRVCRVLEEECNVDGGSPHNHQQQPTPTIPLFPQPHLLRPSTLFSTREQGSRGEVPHHQLCTSRQCRTSDLLLLSPQVLLLRQSMSSNLVVTFADDVWSAGVVLLFSCLQLYATTVVVGDGSADDDDGEGTTAQQHTMDKSFGNDASSMLLLLRDVVNDVIIPSGTPLSHLRGYYALVERLRRGLSDELQRQQEREEEKRDATSSGNRSDNHDDEPEHPIACLVNTIVASHIDRETLVQLCHMIHPSGSHRLEHFADANHFPLYVVKTLLLQQDNNTSIAVATSNEEEVQEEEDNEGSAPTTTMGEGRGWKHWMRRLPPMRSRATTSIGAMTLLQQQQHQVRGMILSPASPFVDIRAQYEVWRSYIEQQCSLENGATSGPQAELQKTAAVWTAWVELLWALTNVGGGSGSSTTSSSSPTQTTAIKRGDRLGSELSVALLQSYPSLFMLSATAAAATAAVTSVVTLSPSASSTSLLLSPAVSPKSSSPLTTGGATAFPTTTTTTLAATSMTPTATVAQMIASTSSRASAFLCALLNKHLLSSSFVGRVQGEGDDSVVELCVPSAVLRHMWRTPSQQVGGGSSPYENGIVATSSPDTFSPTFPASSTLLTEVEERFQRRYGAAPPSLSTVVVPPPLNPEWYNSSHHSLLLPTSQQQSSSTFDHHQNGSILSPLVGGGAAQRSRRHQQQGHAALHNNNSTSSSMKLQHPQRDERSHHHKTPQHRLREPHSEFVAVKTPEMHLVAFEHSSSCDVNFMVTLRKLVNRSEALLCALSTQPPNNGTNIDNNINSTALPPEENRRRRLLLVSELKKVWEGMRGEATIAETIALTSSRHHPPAEATTPAAAIPRVPSQFRGYLWRAMLSLALSSLRPSSSASSSSADIAPNTDAFALLPLSGLHDVFSRIDVRTPTCNDRQVAVDIPRCHQYDPFLSSPEGQRKLLHVVKAWLATAPTMMYWQGVDSVVAVLLHATNGDEALSLLLLSLMLRRWIPHFFLKGNQGAMEHRLMQLSLLLRYYDPELAHHVFDKLECKPELFAISWFLTIFAHVLPVRKCTVVWDFVFGSGSPEATVCLACAVMLELRNSLMHASDFPTVVSLLAGSFAAMDVLHLLEEASLLLASTPPSVLEPALSDPVTASLVKTSCCCLLSPADIAGVTKKNLDSTVDARVNASWASKGGVLLLDIRTNDERRRGWVGGHNNLTSFSASAAQQSRNITAISQANKKNSGAVEVAFDTLRGWRVEEPIGNEDEQPNDDFVMVDAAYGRGSDDDDDDHIHRAGAMDGEPVLRLLGRPHMLWYPAAPNINTTCTITTASSSSASSAAFAGAAAISESPHVVIITGTEPEDGQSAVESLQRLGVAKVSMLLGGIKALEAAVPYVVIAAS